jgi:phosphoglycerol transferase
MAVVSGDELRGDQGPTFRTTRVEQRFQVSLAITVPILIAWLTHKLSFRTLSKPWNFSGDILSAYSFSQSHLSGLFGFKSDIYGSPASLDYRHDTFDFFNSLLLVIARKLTGDPFLAVNLFYLATFPLTALIFYFTARSLRVNSWTACSLGIVFSVIPYHFYRFDQGHISLAAYFMIPLGILSIYRLREGLCNELQTRREGFTKSNFLWFGVNVIVGSSVAYYALFLTLLASSLFLFDLVIERRRASVRKIGTSFAVISGFIVVPLAILLGAPSPAFPVDRKIDESLIFGGTITKLLVPWIPALPDKISAFVEPQTNELEWVGISVLSWFGLVLLVTNLRSTRQSDQFLLRSFRILTAIAILYFLSGGLGYLFSTFIFPDFRAWNRFSVIIECISLLSLGAMLTVVLKSRSMQMFSAGIILLSMLVFNVFPLGSIGASKLPSDSTEAVFNDVKEFSSVLRANVQPGCSILILPTILYPEGGIVNDVNSGDHFRLGILNPQYRWSYGASKFAPEGRFWESAAQDSQGEGVGEILRAKSLGFCAAVLDTRAEFYSAMQLGDVVSEESTSYDLILLD